MANQSYSPLFHTVYDETVPIGSIGRGVHYSILSAPQWYDYQFQLANTNAVQRLAVIWDEDHDTRVIKVMEHAYFAGLLAPVIFIGERKGFLSVGIDDINFKLSSAVVPKYTKAWEDIAQNMTGGDSWPAELFFLSAEDQYGEIIADEPEKVITYLHNISNLWNLGTRPFVSAII